MTKIERPIFAKPGVPEVAPIRRATPDVNPHPYRSAPAPVPEQVPAPVVPSPLKEPVKVG